MRDSQTRDKSQMLGYFVLTKPLTDENQKKTVSDMKRFLVDLESTKRFNIVTNSEHTTEVRRAVDRVRRSTPEEVAKRKAYYQKPEVKERAKAYQAHPDIRKRQNEKRRRDREVLKRMNREEYANRLLELQQEVPAENK